AIAGIDRQQRMGKALHERLEIEDILARSDSLSVLFSNTHGNFKSSLDRRPDFDPGIWPGAMLRPQNRHLRRAVNFEAL
ncbi:MAG: hypothetical protein ACLP02_08825, partial [Rhodomicrobium sp.]